jgi:hypothetical protein
LYCAQQDAKPENKKKNFLSSLGRSPVDWFAPEFLLAMITVIRVC